MQQVDVSSIISIEDVDSFIDRNSGDSWTTTQFKLNPFETRFWGESVAHRRLLLLKSLYRAHPAVDKQFKERRTLHMLQATSQPSPVHLYAFEKLFSQINRELGGCFGGGQVKRFLDLGCSPGGFSTWLLKSNGYAGVQGVGVTLPDDEARFPLQIDPMLSATALSYRVLFGDVMKLSMEAIMEGTDPIVPLGETASGALIDAAQYDLIIGNAFPTLRGPTRWWLRVQLVLSQILIMITNVAQGGSCIVTVNTKPFLWVVDAIGLLQKMFDTITPFKGTLHASRTVGYLICRGFRATPEEVDYYAGRVRVVLRQLDAVADESRAHEEKSPVEDSSDDDGEQLPQSFLPEALPLLTGESAAEIFDAQHRLVLDLFEPMWKAQFDAIHRDFERLLSGEMVPR
ncbi:uncharacterized protein LAESUDRAFT_661073 [Laetiporus sulphureus 93-53]|uniref:Ribosomal RNA methyltransferase FtsJ domain-containing protein n=1 Tax=Laetiporus sulphureus 93-53 TaxID=1314785 RepID=A0A165CHI9_9APHY|nr:uncharacterized protein LAESUDRAFT_661073 [Laetiporus sulphureus 93-53]KZT02825.1 hypothetical protein LAESUDRAFT_661073 [Laetiporus sulphureus 93-53]